MPIFVLQYDGRFGGPPPALVDAYESLRDGLSFVTAQVLALDSQTSASATIELISIIQTAYSVSLATVRL